MYIDKERVTAGKVEEARLRGIEKVWWSEQDNEMKQEEVNLTTYNFGGEGVQVYCDDMLDTGNTAGTDNELLSKLFTNIDLRIFVATHPVLSKGLGALDKIGADVFVVGNTLQLDGLSERKDTRIVDVSPAIYRHMSEN